MSATLLLGIAGIGAAAIFAIEKKKNGDGTLTPAQQYALDHAKEQATKAGMSYPDQSPMSYPDTTQYSPSDPRAGGAHSGDGGTVDTGLDGIAGLAGTPGPVDEPETPATGTGPHATTFGPTGVLSGGAPKPTGLPPSVLYKTVPIVEYAFGSGTGTIGRTATSQTYATTGVKIGAIW